MFQEAGAYEPQANVCKKGGPLSSSLPSPLLWLPRPVPGKGGGFAGWHCAAEG